MISGFFKIRDQNMYAISNEKQLRQVLLADVILGGGTAIAGLSATEFFAAFFGLSQQTVFIISAVTLLYAIFAFVQYSRSRFSITQLRILMNANWIWTFISILMLVIFYRQATKWGVAFLVAQVLVVGGLAYLEGKLLTRN